MAAMQAASSWLVPKWYLLLASSCLI